MRVFQCGNRQQNADEEHQRTHVDLAQGMHQGEVLFGIVFLAAMHDVTDHPQNPQAKQNAQKRRQMGERLEDRHRHQNAQPQEEHQVALKQRRA